MAAASAKSATAAPEAKAERTAARDERVEGRNAGIDTSMADPVDQLQRIAGNRAVSTLVALRNPGSNGGETLPRHLRSEMEARFGEDFAAVRIHVGGRAADTAAAFHAKAYTIGQNIVFGARRYTPETFDGRRLLAHELAHVVQQRRGGAVPELRRGSALELAADEAARKVTTGAGPVMVGAAAAIGVARETDEDEDEFDKALSTWTTLDQQTEEEARRKPGPPPKHDSTTATTNPPPKSDTIDKVLQDSRIFRDQRNRALKRRNRALRRGQDPSAFDVGPEGSDYAKYRDAAREAGREGPEAQYADKGQKIITGSGEKRLSHTELLQNQPKMSLKDMFNKIVAMRGFGAGAAVWERERLDREYRATRRQAENHPETPAIDALHEQNTKLREEIVKLNRSADKQGKLAAEDQGRLEKLQATLDANIKTIKASPVTALRSRVTSLHNKLAISRLPDPDAPEGASAPAAANKGAPAGRGENTCAIIQVIGKDGKILAVGIAKNTAKKHAEQNALDQIERQIREMKDGLPPGARVEVVGDQVVCTSICRKDLAKFAADHHVDRVDGYTFNAVKPSGKPKGGKRLSSKTTAVQATTSAARGWVLDEPVRDEIYAGGKMIGGEELTPGEKHRHRHSQKKTQQAAPTPKAGQKGPPTDATRRRTKRAGTRAAVQRAPIRSGGKSKPTGKAPPAKSDAAKTPHRTRAAPTASAAKTDTPTHRTASVTGSTPQTEPAKTSAPTAAPAVKRSAPARRQRQNKTPTVPPPAPTQTQIPSPTKRGGQPTGKRAGGAAPAPSPAAKARVARTQSAPKPAPKAPAAKPAPLPSATRAQGGSPPQLTKRSVDASRVTRPVTAPGSIGATAQVGLQATQQHGKGITTGQSVGVTGGVSIDIVEAPDSSPQKYRVTLHVDVGGELGVSAGRESAGGGARAGISLSGSGSLSASFSHELSADEARQYQAAAQRGLGGKYQELEVVRLLAANRTDAARSLLEKIKAASGSAEAAQHLGKGGIVQTSAESSVGGGLSAGVGKTGGIGFGVEVGVFRSGKVERTVEERDGRIIVTMTIATEAGRTLGGAVSEGLASVGYSHTGADNRLRAVSFSLDPNDKDFQAKFDSIARVGSIEELDRLRGQQPELAGATTTGEGTSHSDTVSAGFAGVGLQFLQGGSYNEQETRDERGLSHRYEGTGTGGISLTIADTPILSSSTTDTFTADVGPDNTATGETKSERDESSLLGTLFAPVAGPAAALAAGKAKPPAPVDQSGAALTDESFGRLSALAEDPSAWLHAWSGNIPAVFDWQETREKVLAARGDRNKIARAIAEFESEGSERSGTVERALGKTGIAFEFPEEIANQKPVYDSLIVGDPVGHARDLAERGQEQAALNELNAANDKLGKLAAAIGTSSGAFESPAKFAEMLNRIVDRRAELRAEIRQLSRPLVHVGSERAETLRAVASKLEIGPPAPGQKADAEAAQRAKNTELFNRVSELIQTCTTLRVREQTTFSHVREEMDSWHLDHLGASIEMAKALTAVKGSYASWDEAIEKLKASYQELGQEPAKAETFAPDRKQWDAVNAQWNAW
jgi:hypothetical protein